MRLKYTLAVLMLLLPAAAVADDGYRYGIAPVVPGVHVIAQPEPFHLQPLGNVTVVEQADGLVLVDAGGSPGAGRRIVELVRTVSAKPVKAIVITHWHGDHNLGTAAILDAWPEAAVIGTAATRDNLLGPPMAMFPKTADTGMNAGIQAQIGDIAAQMAAAAARPELTPAEREGFAATARTLARYREDMDGVVVSAPDRTFTDRLVLDDPAAPVEILFLGRANTDGDAVVWLPRQRVLVTGDIVVAPVPFGFGSYPADWLAVLRALKGFDFAHLVPGHGQVQTDSAYLDQLIELIGDVRRQVAALAGLELEEARAKLDLERHAASFAGNDPWLRRWFKSYWADPILTSAWREARGLPISQGE